METTRERRRHRGAVPTSGLQRDPGQVTARPRPRRGRSHHFPGGKDELTAAVLASAGAAYGQLVEAIWDAEPDAVSAVRAVFDGAAVVLEETDFIDPCPIGTIAREVASTNDGLRRAALGPFEAWTAAICDRLLRVGLARDEAEEWSTTLVAAAEGGFILSRTARDADVLRATGRRLAAALRYELARSAEPVDGN